MSRQATLAGIRQNARPQLLWIAWERHRRTLELCRYFGIAPEIFASTLPRWLKHPWFVFRTSWCLLRQRPAALVVQNPSVVLAFIACLLRRPGGYRLIIDTHNAGIRPEHPLLRRLAPLYRYLQRCADLTVVTNEALAEAVRAHGGRPLCLPDRLPTPPATNRKRLSGRHNVVFICTFGVDEPYREALAAAENLPPDVHLYVTGNAQKLSDEERHSLPSQVTLTGFLPEQEYWDLLAAADLVMDLTCREDCLVCGAYEAVAIGTPLLLSDTSALRTYFRRGAMFTDHRPQVIAENILRALSHLPELRRQIADLREELTRSWETDGEKLRVFVEESR